MNITNSMNETPLLNACRYNNTQIIQLLLKYNADANIKPASDNSPLFLACKRKNINAVKSLLEHGAKVDCEKDMLDKLLGK